MNKARRLFPIIFSGVSAALLFLIGMRYLEIEPGIFDEKSRFLSESAGILFLGGSVIIGFFLVVFIARIAAIRLNGFEPDESNEKKRRVRVSYKMVYFVFPVVFVSFMIAGYPLFQPAVVLRCNGINTLSFTVINLSLFVYILCIHVFRRISGRLFPYWLMHGKAYRRLFVYYLVNSFNILSAVQVWVFYKPLFTWITEYRSVLTAYLEISLLFWLSALCGSVYLLIQNFSFLKALCTDYLVFESTIIRRLIEEIHRLNDSDFSKDKQFMRIKERWKSFDPYDTREYSNLDINRMQKDINIMQRMR